jgi:ribosomal protein S18 acetylase RimI-like enzyme
MVMRSPDTREPSAQTVARIRHGGPDDARIVVALFDEAVAWLVGRGQTGQWGSEPFSSRDSAVSRIAEWSSSGGLWIAEDGGGEPVGAIVLGARPPWVASADEPELYVEALVTSRRHAGKDVGGALVRHAVEQARAIPVPLLRVDCWGDATGLVGWYERQGFQRSGTFELEDGWHGQVLSMNV